MSIFEHAAPASPHRDAYRAFGLELTLPRLRLARPAPTDLAPGIRDEAMIAAARSAFASLDISVEGDQLRYRCRS
jgi:hypothetical protein